MLALPRPEIHRHGTCARAFGGSLRGPNAAAFASAHWTIPANPAVRGLVVHEQVLTLDLNGALLGFASLTGAVQLRVGD